jgi:hypothetical protein
MARRDIPLGELAGLTMVPWGNPRHRFNRVAAQVIFRDFHEFA